MTHLKKALTIAGSDSGGGAGIQADIKTFSAFGVYGMSVIASVTAQNTVEVTGIYNMPPDFVALQFDTVYHDIGVDGVKTGMLSKAAIVKTVAQKLRENSITHVVVDPVMIAKGGSPLLQKEAVFSVKTELIAQATLITPNIPEAEVLSDVKIISKTDMKKAAEIIHKLGSCAVLVKGGHSKGDASDILFDGEAFFEYAAIRINTVNTHGTGCTLSAAILSNLVLGKSMSESVAISKEYITRAIASSLDIGQGHGPLNHFVRITD